MLEFVQNWWGIIVAVIAAILFAIFDWQRFKKRVLELIFYIEEQARKKAIATGREKFEWVAENGYQYVPAWAKLFVSEAAFRLIIQKVFDSVFKWAEAQKLT
jgi:hypothetical protein